MADGTTTQDEARQAVLDAIARVSTSETSGEGVKALAEAYKTIEKRPPGRSFTS